MEEQSQEDNLDIAVNDEKPIKMDSKGNYSPRSVKKLERTFDQIKDLDDTELKPWERIMRVNYFIMQLEVHKIIEKRL